MDEFKLKCNICGHIGPEEHFENPDADFIKVDPKDREKMSEFDVMEVIIHNVSVGTRCPICLSNDAAPPDEDPYSTGDGGELV